MRFLRSIRNLDLPATIAAGWIDQLEMRWARGGHGYAIADGAFLRPAGQAKALLVCCLNNWSDLDFERFH